MLTTLCFQKFCETIRPMDTFADLLGDETMEPYGDPRHLPFHAL